MEIYRFVSYKTVVEQAKSKFKFLEGNFTEIQAKQWLSQLMAVCQVHHSLQHAVKFVEVVGGRTELPENFNTLLSVALSCEEDITQAECNPANVLPMKWDTSDANTGVHYVPLDYYVQSSNTYVIRDGHVYTSFNTGIIRIAYKRLPEDDNGDPMVPDEGSWIQAGIYDMAYNVSEDLYMQAKLDGSRLAYIERQRDHYVAQAITKAKMFNRPQRENQKDNWIKTIKDLYPEDRHMASLAEREYRRWHGSYNSTRSYRGI